MKRELAALVAIGTLSGCAAGAPEMYTTELGNEPGHKDTRRLIREAGRTCLQSFVTSDGKLVSFRSASADTKFENHVFVAEKDGANVRIAVGTDSTTHRTFFEAKLSKDSNTNTLRFLVNPEVQVAGGEWTFEKVWKFVGADKAELGSWSNNTPLNQSSGYVSTEYDVMTVRTTEPLDRALNYLCR